MAGFIQHYPDLFWFCCCALVSGATSVIMINLAKHFLYYDGTIRRFSIMQLEFPANSSSIEILISQIRALPKDRADLSLKVLRGQLWVDFTYMAGTYCGIYFLTRMAAAPLSNWLNPVLLLLGKLQFLVWLFDIIENLYLLIQIRRPSKMPTIGYLPYWMMEYLKWGLALGIAAIELITIGIYY